MNLKDLRVNLKTIKAPFPGLDGFVVDVNYITRETSTKLQEDSMVTAIDPKLKMPVEELDKGKFLEKFCEAAIKGWSGLKYKYLEQLLLVDLSSVPNIEDEMEYTKEDAVELIKGSQAFDRWINEVIFDLERFRGK